MAAPKDISSRSRTDAASPSDPDTEQVKSPVEGALQFIIAGANAFEAEAAIAAHFPGSDPKKVLADAAEFVAGTVYTPIEFALGLSALKLDDLHMQLRSTGDFAGAAGAVNKRISLTKWIHTHIKGADPNRPTRRPLAPRESSTRQRTTRRHG